MSRRTVSASGPAVLLALSLIAGAATAAQAKPGFTAPDKAGVSGVAEGQVQLLDLTSAEADELVRKLQEAQDELRSGGRLQFELLSGAPASYPMTTVSPREAFLSISFDRPFSIAKLPPSHRGKDAFRMHVLPNGPGKLMWDVEVVLGFQGQVERVEMFYRPPPPA